MNSGIIYYLQSISKRLSYRKEKIGFVGKALTALLLFLSLSLPSVGQKKEIAQAKDQVKAGKNLDQAQKAMEKLLADPVNHNNKKIWLVLYEAVQKQYEQNNEKLYLKQKTDTAALFDNCHYLFRIAAQFDSVDAAPDHKGRVKPEYRSRHAEYLDQIRPNLFNGGAYFIGKQQYDKAYRFFDMYADCYRQPLFKEYRYLDTDKRIAEASYWAVYCGYKMKDPKATLHRAYTALKDTAHYNYMLQYLAETYKIEKDSVRYLETLSEGFSKYPEFPYFFPRLVEYYSATNRLDSALEITNKALQIVPDNQLFLFTKSTVLLNMGRNEECISICDTLIARNDSLAEAYYNAGLAYFNMAVKLDKNTQVSRQNRNRILRYYQKAEPYLERYRQLKPEEKEKWALPLYTVYLNLNKGNEFDEIDKLLRDGHK